MAKPDGYGPRGFLLRPEYIVELVNALPPSSFPHKIVEARTYGACLEMYAIALMKRFREIVNKLPAAPQEELALAGQCLTNAILYKEKCVCLEEREVRSAAFSRAVQAAGEKHQMNEHICTLFFTMMYCQFDAASTKFEATASELFQWYMEDDPELAQQFQNHDGQSAVAFDLAPSHAWLQARLLELAAAAALFARNPTRSADLLDHALQASCDDGQRAGLLEQRCMLYVGAGTKQEAPDVVTKNVRKCISLYHHDLDAHGLSSLHYILATQLYRAGRPGDGLVEYAVGKYCEGREEYFYGSAAGAGSQLQQLAQQLFDGKVTAAVRKQVSARVSQASTAKAVRLAATGGFFTSSTDQSSKEVAAREEELIKRKQHEERGNGASSSGCGKENAAVTAASSGMRKGFLFPAKAAKKEKSGPAGQPEKDANCTDSKGCSEGELDQGRSGDTGAMSFLGFRVG